MDLTYTDQQQSFRKEVRDWLAANMPKEPLASFDTEEGFAQHRAWERKLAGVGFSAVTWPKEVGGRGCDLIEWLIFEEEYWRAGAPLRVNQNGIFLLAPTLMEFGSEEQKKRFLPRMATSDDVWAQGWSEPGAGSDMAAIRTKAVRDGDHYVLNGQKTWSTRAVWADWMFGMFRSDPDSQRHHGLTFLLLPLELPGITIRPIKQLNGLTGFAEVFFDNVRVPVENRLGDEGQGWNIAMTTAGFERGLMLRSPGRFQQTAKALVDLYQSNRARADADPAVRDAVLRSWMGAEAYALATYGTASRLNKGGQIGAEASTNKIFWSELDLLMHETAMSILGARAELMPYAPDAGEIGHWLDGFLFAQAGPIYAGTNEIQRNIIAERMLGLPKVRPMDFTFDDQQLAFRDAVRKFLMVEAAPEMLREIWETKSGRSSELRAKLAEQGLTALSVPEAQGGMNLGDLDWALIQQELGYYAIPDSLSDTAYLAVQLLRELPAGAALRDEWLAKVASGNSRIAIGHPLNPLVADAENADLLLLWHEDEVHAIKPGTAKLIFNASIDMSRRLFSVHWKPSPATRVCDAKAGAPIWAAVVNRAGLAVAAQLVGLAQRMLDLGIDYAAQRKQFGKPVGSFQAVKHHLADVAVKIEFARPVVFRAAYDLAHGRALAPAHVSHARLAAGEAATFAARRSLQAHGAMGYTWEADLQMFMKRAWALDAAWGDRAFHKTRVAGHVLAEAAKLGPSETFN